MPRQVYAVALLSQSENGIVERGIRCHSQKMLSEGKGGVLFASEQEGLRQREATSF